MPSVFFLEVPKMGHGSLKPKVVHVVDRLRSFHLNKWIGKQAVIAVNRNFGHIGLCLSCEKGKKDYGK